MNPFGPDDDEGEFEPQLKPEDDHGGVGPLVSRHLLRIDREQRLVYRMGATTC